MPIELARADVEFLINGTSFIVDAYEADIALGKIDAKYAAPGCGATTNGAELQERRWRDVSNYVNRHMNLWWFQRKRRCTIKQAINFYHGVQDSLRLIAEEDAKKAHPFAESPTGTASTPANSENGNSSPTSPTSTASTPSGS